jgi:hypothetical protein
MKETDKRIGRLTNRFGEIVEYMFVPNLTEEFKRFGYTFSQTQRDKIIHNPEHGISTEMDAFLENGDCAMVVEVKSKLDIKDVDDHVLRMEMVRKNADLHNDKRKLFGALASPIISPSERTYALKRGFYVIEASGENVKIIAPDGFCKPRTW